MLHFEQIIDCPAERFAVFGVPAERVLFFDIETTGFSPESSYVYLIGGAFLSGGAVKLRQWFLDDISEEKELISEFGAFSKIFLLLVHYNGSTFDLPYLQKKARRHHLDGSNFCPEETGAENRNVEKMPAGKKSFDLYRHLLPCKKLLGLKDLKQKTVERFLGVVREDVLDGGDLISVYAEFTGRYRYECITRGNPFQDAKTAPSFSDLSEQTPDFTGTGLAKMPESPAKALLFVLLLHNREDITGLLRISPLLDLPRFLNGAFTVSELSGDEAKHMGLCASSSAPYRFLRLDTGLAPALLSACFAYPTVKQLPDGALMPDGAPAAVRLTTAEPAAAKNSSDAAAPAAINLPDMADHSLFLLIPVLSGTFKYFFENYKDYYYLPMEDCAMHKSVAQFVEKDYRKKATKETCYQKKEGFFLPQPEEIISPAFRLHAKDRFSYFENTETALANPSVLKNWTCALLKWLFA